MEQTLRTSWTQRPATAQVVLRVVKKYDYVATCSYTMGSPAERRRTSCIGAIKGRGFEVVQPGELSER